LGCLRRSGPEAIREEIYADIAEILKRPELRKAAEARSIQPLASNAEEFQRMIGEETEKWRRVLNEAKIKMNSGGGGASGRGNPLDKFSGSLLDGRRQSRKWPGGGTWMVLPANGLADVGAA
jgi:hypothetical protein